MRKLIWILCFCLLFLVACTKNAKSPGNTNNTKQPTKTETSENTQNSAANITNTNSLKTTINSKKPVLSSNTSKLKLKSLLYKDTKYKNHEVHYPSIYGHINAAIQKKLNSAIYSLIETHATKALNSGDSSTEVSLNTNYEVKYNKNNLFSIRFYHTDYFGGAHPGSEVESITLDTTTGNKVLLDDYFLPEFNYINRTNDYIVETLNPTDIELFRDFEGVVNKEAYYLSNSGFVFFFQAYDYTPYAYGPLEFVVPYSEYSNLNRPL